MKTKKTKTQRIAELERQLLEARASSAHTYYFAEKYLDKTTIDKCMGSGIVMTLHFIGGAEVCTPVLIRDGLSKNTIEALKADMRRSYELAVQFKPTGVA